MKVQLISNGNYQHYQKKKDSDITIKVSPLSSPQSLDEFDVDIIDLSTPSLWYCKKYNECCDFDSSDDFASIQQMVDRKRRASVFYVLPANELFHFYSPQNLGDEKQKPLKNCLELLSSIIYQILPSSNSKDGKGPSLSYENTTTKLEKITYKASFYFENFRYFGWDVFEKSIDSYKATIIGSSYSRKKVYLTTLQILESEEKLINFIQYFFPPATDEPKWVKGIHVLNDEELDREIESKKQAITQLEKEIEKANSNKKDNARIKSILYTNGDQLVKVVFEILEKLLSCDLSTFEDEKEWDFLIQKDNYTLIGEIKGVTSNIQNKFISQLRVNYQKYLDKLEKKGLKENVYQILIINPSRSKPLSKRPPVTEEQINLATCHGSLIIETKTLLKLYEKFVAGDIDVAECEKLFTTNIGLLNI